uniref:RRM domain-containing protein n=1 Tax=Heterorhabditis bacteriophora TaxID=37862 RepID=A0A1I7X7A7_HETBA
MVTKTKKVFIGGLSASSTLEDMKTYFEQYGKLILLHITVKFFMKIKYVSFMNPTLLTCPDLAMGIFSTRI